MTRRGGTWIQRWRVPLGFVCAALFLFFAKPTPKALLIGASISLLGLAFFVIAMALGFTYLVLALINVDIPWGNPTLVMLISLFSGVQLLSLGVMGEYVGRIYDEVKRRPMFIIESMEGFERTRPEDVRAPGSDLQPTRLDSDEQTWARR